MNSRIPPSDGISGADDGRSGSYLDFYQNAYGEFLIEKKLVEGRDMVGMFMTRQPAGQFPDAPLDEYNIQMCVSPSVRSFMDIGDGEFETILRQGDFIVVPPDTASDYRLEGDHTVLGLGLPKAYFTAALADFGESSFDIQPLLRFTQRDRLVQTMVKEAWREASTGGDLGALYVDATILGIVSRVIGLATRAQQRETAAHHERIADRQMALLTEYVDSNVDAAIRLKTLANMVGMSEFAFTRAFKQRIGLPPYQWVIERRIEKAKELLVKSDLALADIAYACGFSSQSHMTSLFSKRVGRTPLEIRSNSR